MRRHIGATIIVTLLLVAVVASAAIGNSGLFQDAESAFNELRDRVTALEERVAALENDDADPSEEPTEEPAEEPVEEPTEEPASNVPDAEVTGHHSGFIVPKDETWQILGDVTTDENVVVYGTLVMRAGSSLTFVDVDEGAFIGGGMDVIRHDVGLWVIRSGVLDVEGTPVQGWNRTGEHPTWDAEHEYVIAPHDPSRRSSPSEWSLGDPIPCTEFAGEQYCAEVANLTRDVKIQGTPEGRAHIFIRSDQPQSIRYAEMRWLAPMIDTNAPDGRYALHFHHAGDGSRGSIVQGVVVRDAGDHAFSPHESHGVTFRDTVAYDVVGEAYWWDPGDHTNDTHYDRVLALDIKEGRGSHRRMGGVRLGKGEGNKITDSTVAASAGRGFTWLEGSPNEWTMERLVAHHTSGGFFSWTNESGDKQHVVTDFVAYRNSRGLEIGAYGVQFRFDGLVSFDNSHSGVHQHAAPRKSNPSNFPGMVFRNGAASAGYLSTEHAITIANRRNCERRGNLTLYENLWLLDFTAEPIQVNQEKCTHSTDSFRITFRDVIVGEERRELEPEDFDILAIPDGGVIQVHRTDGTSFTIHADS